jgi:hypothetical protein
MMAMEGCASHANTAKLKARCVTNRRISVL